MLLLLQFLTIVKQFKKTSKPQMKEAVLNGPFTCKQMIIELYICIFFLFLPFSHFIL